MNTALCDMEDGTLADVLGPLILDWYIRGIPWAGHAPIFYRNRSIIDKWDQSVWCLSELVGGWASKARSASWAADADIHEGCKWQ